MEGKMNFRGLREAIEQIPDATIQKPLWIIVVMLEMIHQDLNPKDEEKVTVVPDSERASEFTT